MGKSTNRIVTGLVILCIFLTGSCDKNNVIPLNVIPVASTVGNYSMLNLSDYATEIKYIPLETNDSGLISAVGQIIYENNKLLIASFDMGVGNYYLFDNTGKFCCKIGQRGQGPDDYIRMNNVFIYDNHVFLMERNKILIYDTTGYLVERIRIGSDAIPVEYAGESFRWMLPLNKYSFVMNLASFYGHYPQAILFERNQSDLKIIKEYPNNVILDKRPGILYGEELGIMYRFDNEIRIFKGINDTIFTIGQDTEMKDAYIFDFGKYRTTLAFVERKEGDSDFFYRRRFILPRYMYESLNHLFIKFNFGYQAPESMELPNTQGGKYYNDDVYSVFDKRTGKLTLMLQPVKGKFGFKNDIDGGPVIFPHYLSANNELVTYIQPEEFLEYYEKIENPSAELTAIANKIDKYDNPIVIIAKLK